MESVSFGARVPQSGCVRGLGQLAKMGEAKMVKSLLLLGAIGLSAVLVATSATGKTRDLWLAIGWRADTRPPCPSSYARRQTLA